MSASITTSYAFNPDGAQAGKRMNRALVTLVSDGSGNCSGNADTATGRQLVIDGVICGFQIVPGSGGNQPTDQFDLTLPNAAGIDMLNGQGANLSNTTPFEFVPIQPGLDGINTVYYPRVSAEVLTPTLSNAGNGKTVQLIIYFK